MQQSLLYACRFTTPDKQNVFTTKTSRKTKRLKYHAGSKKPRAANRRRRSTAMSGKFCAAERKQLPRLQCHRDLRCYSGSGSSFQRRRQRPGVPRPSLYWDFTSRPLVPMAPRWRQRNAYHARTGSSLHRCAGDIVGQARQRQLGDNQGFAFASSFLQDC